MWETKGTSLLTSLARKRLFPTSDEISMTISQFPILSLHPNEILNWELKRYHQKILRNNHSIWWMGEITVNQFQFIQTHMCLSRKTKSKILSNNKIDATHCVEIEWDDFVIAKTFNWCWKLCSSFNQTNFDVHEISVHCYDHAISCIQWVNS